MFTIDNSSKETVKSSFYKIARKLITSTVLAVNNQRFSFTDIEFYYYCDRHPDKFAKGVTHLREAGQLEMHRYGIDISLGKEEDIAFGGILIKGLYRETDSREFHRDNIIYKPGVVRSIFNNLEVGENRIEFLDQNTRWKDVFNTSRQNLGSTKSEYRNAWYRYLAKDEMLVQNFKGKEEIIRNSGIEKSAWHRFIGYSI